MIFLSDFSYRDILKDLANKHPILIYFLCFRNNPIEFPNIGLFDFEKDCCELERFGLANYKYRYGRRGHDVTEEDCRITRFGIIVYNELKFHNICQKMFEFSKSLHNLEEFLKKFEENFTFEVNEERLLQNMLINIENELLISFAKPGYSNTINGNSYQIDFDSENDKFFLKINLKCECSQEIEFNIKLEDFKKNLEEWNYYVLQCNSCDKRLRIEPTLFNGKII